MGVNYYDGGAPDKPRITRNNMGEEGSTNIVSET